MKTGDLARWLDISVSSVKTWSREFGEYLSPAAQGGDNSARRYFDEQDARVLALVADLRARNIPWADIHATLASLKANEWADLPPMPGAPPGVTPQPVVTQSEAQNALIQQRQTLAREIALLNDRVNALQGALDEEREAHTRTREALATARGELGVLQGKLEVLEPERAQAHALQEQLTTTQHTLGELSGRLAVIEETRQAADRLYDQQRQFQTRLLIGAAALALILLAAVLLLALTGG